MGTLHTCAELKSGIEATTHAVKKSYEEEGSECLLLVDADNAFNKLNRKVSLKNIKRLSPHVHIHTQQLQRTHRPISGKRRPHTVTGGCDTRGQCNCGNVRLIHTTTDTNTEQ